VGTGTGTARLIHLPPPPLSSFYWGRCVEVVVPRASPFNSAGGSSLRDHASTSVNFPGVCLPGILNLGLIHSPLLTPHSAALPSVGAGRAPIRLGWALPPGRKVRL